LETDKKAINSNVNKKNDKKVDDYASSAKTAASSC
jgi:hypothetical protein